MGQLVQGEGLKDNVAGKGWESDMASRTSKVVVPLCVT
jgi:hypothetical protein